MKLICSLFLMLFLFQIQPTFSMLLEDGDKKFSKRKRAAEQGDKKAQSKLGQMYYCGLGVRKNDNEAFKWYKRSMEQWKRGEQGVRGDPETQFGLGNCY